MGFIIQKHISILIFTDKSYFVTTIYSLSILQNIVLFKTLDNINPDKSLCFNTLHIQDDIMIVFTMAFKRLLKFLKTYVNFTGLKEENYFRSRKMFTCRKLTGVETLLLVSILFQLNENTYMCTAIAFNIPPHTHTYSLLFIYT